MFSFKNQSRLSTKKDTLHPILEGHCYVDVVLPLAIPDIYTYAVPEDMVTLVKFGLRCEVVFGKRKRYAAIIVDVHRRPPSFSAKPILSVIDEFPIIHPVHYRFWKWLSDYYCCHLGEVVDAALPANLKLNSERRILLSPIYAPDINELNDKEYLLTEALSIQGELTLDDVRGILNIQTVLPTINAMLDKRLIYLKEEMQEKYTPKKVVCVRLMEPYVSNPSLLNEAFELVARSDRQVTALMAFAQLYKKQPYVLRQDLYTAANIDSSVINAIVKKEIFELYEKEVSRLGGYEEDLLDTPQLSDHQTVALRQIAAHHQEGKVVLLHGVTGSGKTRVYMELIEAAIARGEQVLYLLPEVALTTQITQRMERVFGDNVGVYHHRIPGNERVELWRQIANGKPLILGARSALLLPFRNLSLIIVDEEHDGSFKQHEPAPRYHGRDAAIYLSTLTGAKVVLGTATPSMESYFHARKGKYGLVEMKERFGGLQMPALEVVDMKNDSRYKQRNGHFSEKMLEEIEQVLKNKEQVILFQNRRGYAPALRCVKCDWHAECTNCDVSLTYHKLFEHLNCHYCGFHQKIPKVCPGCGSAELRLQGFGTEKLEEELALVLPDAIVKRMDHDTVKTKDALSTLINDFEERRIDILVGTQMVTKGLDFDNVQLVGVVSADSLLQYPDYRAGERAFQLITQVSGRAGRKNKQGKVLIQAANVAHPVLLDVLEENWERMFQRELMERQAFAYPPFGRLIKISLKHKDPKVVNEAGKLFTHWLKQRLPNQVIGPAVPPVGRVRNLYLLDVLIKLPNKSPQLQGIKDWIKSLVIALHQQKGLASVRVVVDVDP